MYRKNRGFVFRSPGYQNDCPSEDSPVQQHSLYLNQEEHQDSDTDPSDCDPQSMKPNLDELLEGFRDNLFTFILKCRKNNLLHLPVKT